MLAWAVPNECPNAESVVQRLMALGGGDAARFADAGTVRGVIVKELDEWVLVLQIAQAADTGSAASAAATTPGRVLRANDCDELANAAAVAIAIALGGSAEAREQNPKTSTPGSSRPAASAERALAATDSAGMQPRLPASSRARRSAAVAPSSPVVSSIASSASSFEAEAPAEDVGALSKSGSSSFGFVPSVELVLDSTSLGRPALGPGVQLQLRWAALGIGVYGLWLPERQIQLAQTQYVELSLLSGGLRGCYRILDAAPTIDACGSAELGALGAAGKGLLDAQRRRDPWGAATGGVLLGVDVGTSLHGGLRLEAVVPFSHERYLVNRDQLVHEVPAASARLALTLAGSFGPH
jgi:hypothetical protein